MRVITAQDSKIRTTERTIKTGGTVIRHVSGFTEKETKKTCHYKGSFAGHYLT